MTELLSVALPVMGCFAVLVVVICWQGRKNSRLNQQNQQLKKSQTAQKRELHNVQIRKTIRHENATAARAELDARLSEHGYYRD